MENMDAQEPILKEDLNRFVMFPIKDPEIWALYKKMVDCFWRAEEIDFSRDLTHWETLSSDEKYFIKMVLAFFAASDGIVIENLGMRFMGEVQLAEARAAYGFQLMMENIHSEVYSLLIDKYVQNQQEKAVLFNALENFPCIRRKAEWALRWIQDETIPFAARLVAFACVEGIFFSGAFCSIYWLKKRGLMPGLTFSNELIARDEGMHTDLAVLIFSKLQKKLPVEQVHKMVSDAVRVEKDFICSALPCRLIGMNANLMGQYIEYVADRLLIQLGYTKIWDSNNPFDFMEMISLQGKTNFFEKRVGDYSLVRQTKKADVFETTGVQF